MTRIKMCGLRYPEDVRAASALMPDYIGFVFFPGSRRYVPPEEAKALRTALDPGIRAVGVFVDEDPDTVACLLEENVIDIAQLHGHEDETYLARLRQRTDSPLIRAFRIRTREDVRQAMEFPADGILLDAGAGDGKTFDWELLREAERPYFLAGGLNPDNVSRAVKKLKPFAVDVSSGIETDGRKDPEKMCAFVRAVREAGRA